jgi:hypothetical protein
MKTMLSFKPVQMRPNRGMVLIHNNYVKTLTVRFALILIGLSHILSWQDCFMSWIRIIIAALFDFKFAKRIGRPRLSLSNPVIIRLNGTILIKVNRSCLPNLQ